MTSTKEERMFRAKSVISTLIGSHASRSPLGNKRPPTLPRGVNYTAKEWSNIREAVDHYRSEMDVRIQILFELEEMAEKYRPCMMLAKLES